MLTLERHDAASGKRFNEWRKATVLGDSAGGLSAVIAAQTADQTWQRATQLIQSSVLCTGSRVAYAASVLIAD